MDQGFESLSSNCIATVDRNTAYVPSI